MNKDESTTRPRMESIDSQTPAAPKPATTLPAMRIPTEGETAHNKLPSTNKPAEMRITTLGGAMLRIFP